MAGYLRNVIRKSVQAAPVLRPRLKGWFESDYPDAGLGIGVSFAPAEPETAPEGEKAPPAHATETTARRPLPPRPVFGTAARNPAAPAPPSPAPPSPAPPSPAPPSPAPPSPAPPSPAPPSPAPPSPASRTVQRSPVAHADAAAHAAEPSAPMPTRTASPAPFRSPRAATPRQPAGEGTSPADRPAPVSQEIPANTAPANALPGRDLEFAPGTAQPPSAPASRSAPTIRVTIGRIEVRAAQPTGQPPSAPARPARAERAIPALSLSDYLKRRAGKPREP